MGKVCYNGFNNGVNICWKCFLNAAFYYIIATFKLSSESKKRCRAIAFQEHKGLFFFCKYRSGAFFTNRLF